MSDDADLAWFRIPTDTSPGTLNAAYQLLDRRVVAGLADEPLLLTESAPVSHARLLEDVAAVGGLLRAEGVGPGAPVAWRAAPTRESVTALLAVARLGGRIDPDAGLVIDDSGIGRTSWDLALRAGRTDPAPAAELEPDAPWAAGLTVRLAAEALARLVVPTLPAALAGALLATTIEQ